MADESEGIRISVRRYKDEAYARVILLQRSELIG